jgi:hypothetical protein
MASSKTTLARKIGGKLIFAIAGLVCALEVSGLPAQEPTSANAQPAATPTRHASPPTIRAAATRVAAAAADQPFIVRHILDIAGPLRPGDYYWDEDGAPDGPIVITVDLAAQTLSIFRNGYEIGTAAILFGADSKPTPLGAFPITQKDAHHVSNLYDAPMPYMLRLTNDGVTIHGSNVRPGYATHGCIGVPTKFAAMLFAATKLGDMVLITRGKMLHLGEPIVHG